MTQRRVDTHLEIALLGVVALGVMILMGVNHYNATAQELPFDPSAYLVVLTLIVGAVKERWTQRSADKMGEHLAGSTPTDTMTASPSAKEAAGKVAEAADKEAGRISDAPAVDDPDK